MFGCVAALAFAGCRSYGPEQLVEADRYRQEHTIEREYTAVFRDIYRQAQGRLPIEVLYTEHWQDIEQYRLVISRQTEQGLSLMVAGVSGPVSLRDVGGVIEVEQAGSRTAVRAWAASRWYDEKYVTPIVTAVIVKSAD